MDFFVCQNRFPFRCADGQKNNRRTVGAFDGRVSSSVFTGRVFGFVFWRDNVPVVRGALGHRGRCPSSPFTQFIQPMGDDVVVEDLNEALTGEGGAVDFVGMVGTEEGEGGLADDGVVGFGGQFG